MDSHSTISERETLESSVKRWPRSSFFAIYDGLDGKGCAEYLRDSLHKFIVQDENFPLNPRKAIQNAVNKAEEEFLQAVYDPVANEIYDESGACAAIVLIVDRVAYVANVGDSKILFS